MCIAGEKKFKPTATQYLELVTVYCKCIEIYVLCMPWTVMAAVTIYIDISSKTLLIQNLINLNAFGDPF